MTRPLSRRQRLTRHQLTRSTNEPSAGDSHLLDRSQPRLPLQTPPSRQNHPSTPRDKVHHARCLTYGCHLPHQPRMPIYDSKHRLLSETNRASFYRSIGTLKAASSAVHGLEASSLSSLDSRISRACSSLFQTPNSDPFLPSILILILSYL